MLQPHFEALAIDVTLVPGVPVDRIRVPDDVCGAGNDHSRGPRSIERGDEGAHQYGADQVCVLVPVRMVMTGPAIAMP